MQHGLLLGILWSPYRQQAARSAFMCLAANGAACTRRPCLCVAKDTQSRALDNQIKQNTATHLQDSASLRSRAAAAADAAVAAAPPGHSSAGAVAAAAANVGHSPCARRPLRGAHSRRRRDRAGLHIGARQLPVSCLLSKRRSAPTNPICITLCLACSVCHMLAMCITAHCSVHHLPATILRREAWLTVDMALSCTGASITRRSLAGWC